MRKIRPSRSDFPTGGSRPSPTTRITKQLDKLKFEFQLTLLMIWGREMSRATMAVKMISGIMYIPLYTTL